jgi:hypothetical protein
VFVAVLCCVVWLLCVVLVGGCVYVYVLLAVYVASLCVRLVFSRRHGVVVLTMCGCVVLCLWLCGVAWCGCVIVCVGGCVYVCVLLAACVFGPCACMWSVCAWSLCVTGWVWCGGVCVYVCVLVCGWCGGLVCGCAGPPEL